MSKKKKKVNTPKPPKPSRVVNGIYGLLLFALAAIPVCITEMLDKGEDKWFLIRTVGPLLAVLLALYCLTKPLKLRRLDPLAVCSIGWIGVMLLSMIDAHNLGVSLVVLTRQIGLLGFFFVVRYFALQRSDILTMNILYVLVFMVFLTAVYGVFQHFGYDYIDWEINYEVPIDRGVSFMGHATFAASLLIMFLPIAFCLALSTPSKMIRVGLFVACLTMLYHLSFSGARVATVALFLSAGIGICVWIFTKLRDSEAENIGSIRRTALVALVICAVMGSGFAYHAWQLKGSDLFGLTEGGMAQRIYAWDTANRMFQANPFNGVGVGHYEIISPEYWNVVESSRFVQFQRMLYQPHNDYLEAAAEMGILGVMCLLALVTFALTQSFALITKYNLLAIGMFTGILASCVDSFFIFAWQTAEPGLYFWTLLGIVSGLYARAQEEAVDG